MSYVVKCNFNGLYLKKNNKGALCETCSFDEAFRIKDDRAIPMFKSLPRVIRNTFPNLTLCKIEDSIDGVSSSSTNKEEVEVTDFETIKKKEELKCDEDFIPQFDLDDIIETFEKLKEIVNYLNLSKDNIVKSISKTDLECQDYLHLIELEDIDKRYMEDIVTALRSIQINRRKCKDAVSIIEVFRKYNIPDTLNGDMLSELRGLNNRMYTPRVYKDIFNEYKQSSNISTETSGNISYKLNSLVTGML